MADRRLGFGLVLIGLLGVVGAQLAAPIAGPPLYDGVVVVDPYRWLVPPAGQKGDPQSATATMKPEGGSSPVAVVATPEQPPQAQIFAASGGLALPPGTTSIDVSITPVPPEKAPADGRIAGNVYRIVAANQDGASISGVPGAQVTVVLRGPPEATEARIARYADGSWQTLDTKASGIQAMYLAVVTDFGDFALVVPGAGARPSAESPTSTSPAPAVPESIPAVPSSGGAAPVALLAAGLFVVGVVLAAAILWLRDRRQRRRGYEGWEGRRRRR